MQTPTSSSDLSIVQQLRDKQQEAKRLFTRLTPCEQQILEMISNGLPNKTIAMFIGRSIKTVEKHRSKLMKKLGMASVCELLRFWCRLRWDEFILGSPEPDNHSTTSWPGSPAIRRQSSGTDPARIIEYV
jgi:DNA-binding CsgD family transcriptional regulator